ncbi:MAG: alpha/beta fold hydrolase, partial [Bacteroidota bacterium]
MRAKAPVEEGFVERDGVKIHYEVFGDGSETMVFVPAWAIVHSRLYKAQVPWFSDRFRCITYDPRGNGLSDRPERVESYRLDEYVADLVAILDAL